MRGLMDLQQEMKGEILVVRMKGRLDALSSPEAERQVFDFINEGQHKLVIDFSGVDYLSSAGMRMLLSTSKKLKTFDGGRLVVFSITPNVMDVLKMSGFDHVLELSKTEDEALLKF